MRFYCEEAEAVLRDVDSTSEGLTSAEAEKRLAANGKNKLAEGKKDSLIKRFFQQMGDPMIIILLVAAAIVCAVVHSVRARKKRGGGCGCGCSGCTKCDKNK